MGTDGTILGSILNGSDEWITQERLLSALGVSVRTLVQNRSRGRYRFKPYRIGQHVFYRRSEILAELERGEDAEQE